MLKAENAVVVNGVVELTLSNIQQHSNIIDNSIVKLRVFTDENMSEFTDIIPTEIKNIEETIHSEGTEFVIEKSTMCKYNDLTLSFPISIDGISYSKIIVCTNDTELESNELIINNASTSSGNIVMSISKPYDIEYVGLCISSNVYNPDNIELKLFIESGSKTEEFTQSYNSNVLYKLNNPSTSINIKVNIKKIGPSMLEIYRFRVLTN